MTFLAWELCNIKTGCDYTGDRGGRDTGTVKATATKIDINTQKYKCKIQIHKYKYKKNT